MNAVDKLTLFFGERDRIEGRWLTDVLGELLVRHRITSAVVLRASEGFGPHHLEQAADLLSLSDDLPLQLIAFDVPERIDALAADLLARHTRARIFRSGGHLHTPGAARTSAADREQAQLQLTTLVGRREHVGGTRAHQALVALAHESGAAGAAVMLGVEGVIDGHPARARFFAANGAVPLAVIASGPREAMLMTAERLAEALPDRAILLEPVTVLKRDGEAVAGLPSAEGSSIQTTVQASGDTRHGSWSLGPELVRALRAAGAAGATSLGGIWGYHGAHQPHGDRLLHPHRGVPLLTTTIAGPATAARSWQAIDAMTQTTGLVTAQRVRDVSNQDDPSPT